MIANELMTPDPFRVRQSAPLKDARALMQDNELRHLPVVDDEDALIGILSDRDLGAYMPWTDRQGDPSIDALDRAEDPVSAVMQPDPFRVTEEDGVAAIIETMITHKVGAIPVVESGSDRLLGIISYIDVLRAAQDVLED